MAQPWSPKHPARSETAANERQQQIKRWEANEANTETPISKDRLGTKVKFDDGVVFLAATSSDDEDEVRRLLKDGSDVNYANVDGLTALHQVSGRGRKKGFTRLVCRGRVLIRPRSSRQARGNVPRDRRLRSLPKGARNRGAPLHRLFRPAPFRYYRSTCY